MGDSGISNVRREWNKNVLDQLSTTPAAKVDTHGSFDSRNQSFFLDKLDYRADFPGGYMDSKGGWELDSEKARFSSQAILELQYAPRTGSALQLSEPRKVFEELKRKLRDELERVGDDEKLKKLMASFMDDTWEHFLIELKGTVTPAAYDRIKGALERYYSDKVIFAVEKLDLAVFLKLAKMAEMAESRSDPIPGIPASAAFMVHNKKNVLLLQKDQAWRSLHTLLNDPKSIRSEYGEKAKVVVAYYRHSYVGVRAGTMGTDTGRHIAYSLGGAIRSQSRPDQDLWHGGEIAGGAAPNIEEYESPEIMVMQKTNEHVLAHQDVMEGSLKVFVNGRSYTLGEHYSFENKTIRFKKEYELLPGQMVKYSYKYRFFTPVTSQDSVAGGNYAFDAKTIGLQGKFHVDSTTRQGKFDQTRTKAQLAWNPTAWLEMITEGTYDRKEPTKVTQAFWEDTMRAYMVNWKSDNIDKFQVESSENGMRMTYSQPYLERRFMSRFLPGSELKDFSSKRIEFKVKGDGTAQVLILQYGFADTNNNKQKYYECRIHIPADTEWHSYEIRDLMQQYMPQGGPVDLGAVNFLAFGVEGVSDTKAHSLIVKEFRLNADDLAGKPQENKSANVVFTFKMKKDSKRVSLKGLSSEEERTKVFSETTALIRSQLEKRVQELILAQNKDMDPEQLKNIVNQYMTIFSGLKQLDLDQMLYAEAPVANITQADIKLLEKYQGITYIPNSRSIRIQWNTPLAQLKAALASSELSAGTIIAIRAAYAAMIKKIKDQDTFKAMASLYLEDSKLFTTVYKALIGELPALPKQDELSEDLYLLMMQQTRGYIENIRTCTLFDSGPKSTVAQTMALYARMNMTDLKKPDLYPYEMIIVPQANEMEPFMRIFSGIQEKDKFNQVLKQQEKTTDIHNSVDLYFKDRALMLSFGDTISRQMNLNDPTSEVWKNETSARAIFDTAKWFNTERTWVPELSLYYKNLKMTQPNYVDLGNTFSGTLQAEKWSGSYLEKREEGNKEQYITFNINDEIKLDESKKSIFTYGGSSTIALKERDRREVDRSLFPGFSDENQIKIIDALEKAGYTQNRILQQSFFNTSREAFSLPEFSASECGTIYDILQQMSGEREQVVQRSDRVGFTLDAGERWPITAKWQLSFYDTYLKNTTDERLTLGFDNRIDIWNVGLLWARSATSSVGDVWGKPWALLTKAPGYYWTDSFKQMDQRPEEAATIVDKYGVAFTRWAQFQPYSNYTTTWQYLGDGNVPQKREMWEAGAKGNFDLLGLKWNYMAANEYQILPDTYQIKRFSIGPTYSRVLEKGQHGFREAQGNIEYQRKSDGLIDKGQGERQVYTASSIYRLPFNWTWDKMSDWQYTEASVSARYVNSSGNLREAPFWELGGKLTAVMRETDSQLYIGGAYYSQDGKTGFNLNFGFKYMWW